MSNRGFYDTSPFTYYMSMVMIIVVLQENQWSCHVDTGRKLNVHKTFRRRPVRFLNVQFTSCFYEDAQCLLLYRYGNIPTRLIKLAAEFLVSSLAFVIIPLSNNPTKLSNTVKQFVNCCRRIVWVLFDQFLGLTLKRLTIILKHLVALETVKISPIPKLSQSK